MMQNCDFLIIGGGIIGTTIAKTLIRRGANNIIIIEKEDAIGLHASGRNSGVMHAGIYYPPNTMKAQFCLKGALRMKDYCRENGLPLLETGKVIVARTEAECPTVDMLAKRARENGAKVSIIDEQELADIEPHAKTINRALYSHYTAVVDPKKIMVHLGKELQQSGKVTILTNTRFIKRLSKNKVLTSKGEITYADKLINAAGSYADRIAHQFGVGQHYSLMPFKGLYKKLKPEYCHLVKGNIYPVPDLRNPFLGVHFTRNIHGDVYLGPTAIPALGRENYGLLQGANSEVFKLLWQDLCLFTQNAKFRRVALTEPKKYLSHFFFQDCQKLVKHLEPSWLAPTQKVGIRPQLIDWKTKNLVMDFLCETGDNSVHVLNAISPAFTSSMVLSEHIVDHYCYRQ